MKVLNSSLKSYRKVTEYFHFALQDFLCSLDINCIVQRPNDYNAGRYQPARRCLSYVS